LLNSDFDEDSVEGQQFHNPMFQGGGGGGERGDRDNDM